MNRYLRNIQLPAFGPEGQERVRAARVGIVGCGALGSVVAMYLAAAGAGTLRIADFDTIDLSNLQRQIFFAEPELGRFKAEVLAGKVRDLNSDVSVEIYRRPITAACAAEFFAGCDVVAECSDNPATKELIVGAGQTTAVPIVVGGVREYEGQVAVFGPGAPGYADVFGAPACSSVLPCSAGAVFSPVPGIVASLQASEILKLLARLPGASTNHLLTFSALTLRFARFSF